MDYGFTEYQRAIRDLAREIAEKEIRPVAAEYDRDAKFPWLVVKVLAKRTSSGFSLRRNTGALRREHRS